MAALRQTLTYWLAEHPSIVGFRWGTDQPWGSTWFFLFTSIALYIASSLFLHLLLLLCIGRRPVPLGPLPALHSLFMAIISATIFAGILLSAASEIHETRWFWRRYKTPLQWLLCFPIGTRPSGRVFFWSYAFYLSRFLHLLRTSFAILRRRRLSSLHLFNRSILILVSFMWLEFSQSFQVLSIIFTTLVSSMVYGYRFWLAIGMPEACFRLMVRCQILVLCCNVVCHVGVVMTHLWNGGCNGIGAWGLNSVLNAAIVLLYVRYHRRKGVTSVAAAAALSMEGEVM